MSQEKLFSLKNITAGYIEIEIRHQGHLFETMIDDDGDYLYKLPLFINAITNNESSEEFLSDKSTCRWAFKPMPSSETGIFNLYHCFDPYIRYKLTELSIEISPSSLMSVIADLCQQIAWHDNFAHGYLFWASESGALLDDFYKTTETEWKEGVHAGRLIDDYDAQIAYEDQRFNEQFPLTNYQTNVLSQARKMLLTQTIPNHTIGEIGYIYDKNNIK